MLHTITNLAGNEIQTSYHIFEKWSGNPITDIYGGKAVLNFKDKPLYAELVALEIFKESGYDGVWVDTYRRKFRIGLPENSNPVELPHEIKVKLQSIIEENSTSNGIWDLLLWKGDILKFVELKRKRKDAIRSTQIKFLTSALVVGFSLNQFEILEWDINS
jgi:hypothetical protein